MFYVVNLDNEVIYQVDRRDEVAMRSLWILASQNLSSVNVSWE